MLANYYLVFSKVLLIFPTAILVELKKLLKQLKLSRDRIKWKTKIHL